MSELYMTVTIINRDDTEDYISFYQQFGENLILGALGHGTADTDTMDYLGLKSKEKAVIFSIAEADISRKALRELSRSMYIDMPGNGIALSIPISSIGGSMMKYLFQKAAEGHPEKANGGERMTTEAAYRLIIVITNHGFTDYIMDLARSAGASGGTVIRAIGTGMEHAEKFFGMSIASEKEMVFIVCPVKDQNGIMKAIVTNAGMKSKAQSMVLSLPVENVAGLRQMNDDDDLLTEG